MLAVYLRLVETYTREELIDLLLRRVSQLGLQTVWLVPGVGPVKLETPGRNAGLIYCEIKQGRAGKCQYFLAEEFIRYLVRRFACYICRKSAMTLPKICTLLTIIGGNAGFSGCKRILSPSTKKRFTVASSSSRATTISPASACS